MLHLRALCLSAALLGGCGLFEPEPVVEEAPAARGKAQRAKAGKSSKGTKVKVAKNAGFPRMRRAINAPGDWDDSQPGLVVMVVMDTVRADHTSLCGYPRPTTPTLTGLLERGAVFTCRAYTPATWTLPSHATFFTGLPTWEHHVLNKGHPLDEEVETLAETFQARGYQTALISANPTLNRSSGLWQGFDKARVAPGLYSAWRGRTLTQVIRETLADLNARKPLFLVVNIFDAHDPYPAIPEGIGWVPPRPGIDLNPKKVEPDGPVRQLVDGTLDAVEKAALIEAVIDTYDYGISLGDQNVARLMKLLQDRNFLDQGVRFLLTSDHGEHLGEHELVRHDGPPWEGVTRVPFMYFDDTAEGRIDLPEPLPAGVVHSLLATGALPEGNLTAVSASTSYWKEQSGRSDAVAVWASNDDKLMWLEGAENRYDLAADPGELAPLSVRRHPFLPKLRELTAAHEASKEIAFATPRDADMMEALKAVGYVE